MPKHFTKWTICFCAVFMLFQVTATYAGKETGFQSIFDGKTLKGWQAPDMHYFSVEDGAITGRVTADHLPPRNQFIVWQGGKVKNFDLRFRFRIFGEHANSGMQFRSKVKTHGLVHGYQADISMSGPYLGGIWDEYGTRHSLAARGERTFYDKAGKKTITTFGDAKALGKKIELSQWNEYRILAVGTKIILEINGIKMCELNDLESTKACSEGILAMPVIPAVMKVQYKDIRIKVLPD